MIFLILGVAAILVFVYIYEPAIPGEPESIIDGSPLVLEKLIGEVINDVMPVPISPVVKEPEPVKVVEPVKLPAEPVYIFLNEQDFSKLELQIY